MRIQLNSYFTRPWNSSKPISEDAKKIFSLEDDTEFSNLDIFEEKKCEWLLTPILLVTIVFMSFMSFFLLWFLKSVEIFAPLGTFQFVDALNSKHGVDISWSNCGNDDFFKVESLAIRPNPVNLHNNISLSMDAAVYHNIEDPIEISVDIQKKFWFKWITVPCIASVGSCNYDDICNYSPSTNNETCIVPLPKSYLPCSCPIKKGKYFAKNSQILITDPISYIPRWLKNGEYYLRVEASTKANAVIGCYKFYFNVYS